jgi:hypothetical protein
MVDNCLEPDCQIRCPPWFREKLLSLPSKSWADSLVRFVGTADFDDSSFLAVLENKFATFVECAAVEMEMRAAWFELSQEPCSRRDLLFSVKVSDLFRTESMFNTYVQVMLLLTNSKERDQLGLILTRPWHSGAISDASSPDGLGRVGSFVKFVQRRFEQGQFEQGSDRSDRAAV